MDFEHVENLLFSVQGSEESFNNSWNEDFDDEMLDVANDEYESDDDLFDAPTQVASDSWDLLSSPLLTAAEISGLPHHDLMMRNDGDDLAKGYPDIASRRFLRQLADHAPHIPMYAFADLDPDGIAIVSTYKYGSYRLAHEDSVHKDAPALSLPNIHWLGVRWHHISRTPTTESDTDTTSMPELQGLMRLTARDRNKAARMLEWDLCSETGPEQEWRHELQTMLMLNIKAEMQILDELGGVALFLSNEIDRTKQPWVAAVVEKASSDDGLLF
ncbi:endodeoxyribonuclease [Ascochyta clinopodiicola]|nr:endodeoxyribonuclease [Ascochyta clinopodiicola]